MAWDSLSVRFSFSMSKSRRVLIVSLIVGDCVSSIDTGCSSQSKALGLMFTVLVDTLLIVIGMTSLLSHWYVTNDGAMSKSKGIAHLDVACINAQVAGYGRHLSMKPSMVTSEFGWMMMDDASADLMQASLLFRFSNSFSRKLRHLNARNQGVCRAAFWR